MFFFANTKNPLPEPVVGGLFAKRHRPFESLRDYPSTGRLTLRCGCSTLRHPELVSGSVATVAECFTDPESSSGWRFFVGEVFFLQQKNPPPGPVEGSCLQISVGPSTSCLTLRCECRDHVAVHGMYLAKVCHPTSVTLNLIQGL